MTTTTTRRRTRTSMTITTTRRSQKPALKAAIYVEVGVRRAPRLLSQTSHLNIIVIKCTNITQFPRTNSVTRSPKRALLQLFIAKSSKKLLTGRDPGYMNSQEQKVAWTFQNDVSVHLYLGKLVKMINQVDVSLSPTQGSLEDTGGQG